MSVKRSAHLPLRIALACLMWLLILSDSHATNFWTRISTGNATVDSAIIKGMAFDAGYIYVGTQLNGVWMSADGGATWSNIDAGNTLLRNQGLAVHHATHNIILGTGSNSSSGGPGAVWLSTNHGGSWTKSATVNDVDNAVFDIHETGNGNILVGGRYQGFWISQDGGNSWTVPTPFTGGLQFNTTPSMQGFASSQLAPGVVVFGTEAQGLYRSTDYGMSWVHAQNNGFVGGNQLALMFSATGELFSTSVNGVYRSSDLGDHWTLVGGLNTNFSYLGMARAADGTLFAGSNGNGGVPGNGVWMSLNNGTNWSAVNSGLPTTTESVPAMRAGLDGCIYLALRSGGLYRTTQCYGGKTATQLHIGASVPAAVSVSVPFTISATVAAATGTPTGNIVVSDGVDSCVISLPSTSCQFVASRTGVQTLTFTYSSDATFLSSTASQALFVRCVVGAVGCNLNVDLSATTHYTAGTDGLLVLRYLQGLRGNALTQGATAIGATRTDALAVAAFLDTMIPLLDVDNNGSVDAATDGVLIVRYLLGIRGNALTAGALGAGASPGTTAAIENAISVLLP